MVCSTARPGPIDSNNRMNAADPTPGAAGGIVLRRIDWDNRMDAARRRQRPFSLARIHVPIINRLSGINSYEYPCKSNKCASFNANPPCCGSALFILLMILKVQRHCSSSTCGRLFVCPGANVTYNAFPHHADRGSIPSTHYAETGPNCE